MAKRWTKEEVDKLYDLQKEGKTYKETGDILHRTEAAVAYKLHELKHIKNKIWPKEDIQKLIELKNSGKSRPEIVEILGYSLPEVINQLCYLKNIVGIEIIPYHNTEIDNEKIAQLRESGYQTKEISSILNIPYTTIRSRINKMLLTGRLKKIRNGPDQISKKEIDRLINLINDGYKNREISEIMGIPQGAVESRIYKLLLQNKIARRNIKFEDNDMVNEIARLRDCEGKTYTEISEILNYRSHTEIHRLYNKYKRKRDDNKR